MNKLKLWNYRRKIKTIRIKVNGIPRDICWLEIDYDGTIRYTCKEGKIFPVGTEKLKNLQLDMNDKK
jgi:hypothetical protein